ncbi:MAG: DUF1858 domain-containing protein [Aquificaceae bacterium]
MKTRITLDTKLVDLIKELPQAKEILMRYGYKVFIEEDVEDVIVDKLTIRGFCKLMDLDDEAQGNLWQEIQDLYRQLEDKP